MNFKSLIVPLLLIPVLALSQETTTVLVDEFDPAPDGNGGFDGQFDFFMQRVVPNDSGVVVFRAFLNTGQQGIFRTDGVNVVQVAREDDAAPDSSGNPAGVFSGFTQNTHSINDVGEVAIMANVQEPDGSFRRGIWRFDGTSLMQIIREGDPAPDGDGVIQSLSHISQINAAGAVAFGAGIVDSAGIAEDAIILAEGTDLITVAREGDLIPGAVSAAFEAIWTSDPGPLLNEAGQVAFIASNDVDNSFEDTALYLWDAIGLSVIASEGSGAPGGGTIRTFWDIEALSANGKVAWRSKLELPDSSTTWGIFRGSTSEVVAIARVGDPAPAPEGGIDGFIDYVIGTGPMLISEEGDVLFRATLSDTVHGTTKGLLRWDGEELKTIIREGDPAPDADGVVSALNSAGNYAINRWGQVVFKAGLTGTAGGATDDFGIFLYDDSAGFLTVAREGDPIGIGFNGGILTILGVYPDSDGFNNSGQVAFYFNPPNHRNAVALYDPGDIFPPAVTQLRPDPATPKVGDTVTLLANVSDAESGGADIASAEWSLDGGDWQQMVAGDGAYDSPAEDVEADINIPLSSEHEICVRGTDALGWTSDPECISIDVGTDFVGLLVRCMHRPLYPQEGDFIEVTAQALDSEGAPVIADEVQIYINDKQNPVQSILGTDGEIAANVISDGEDIFYGCQAIRGTEKAFSRYVTVDIGDPLIPGFQAIPVLYHGAMSEKIDLVFFAELDSYPEGTLSEDFLEDLHGVIREGLFDIPWFVRWQYVLNVWIAREEVDVTPRAVPGQAVPLCASEKPTSYGKKYSFGDAVGIIHVEDCRDMAIPLWPFTTRYEPTRLQVVAHEIGHKAFSLSDEYVTSSTVRYSISPEPNLFPTLNGCMQAADERGYDPDECRLLPGGLLNTNGRYIFEPDYRNVDDPFSETGDLMQQTGNAACAADPEDVCERYRIGNSERARVFWKLAKCIAGEC